MKPRGESWALDWRFGRVKVLSLGGMLGPVNFRLANGRSLQPMYLAPWIDDPNADNLPPLLRELRGELPCVPFGRTDFPAGLDGWTRRDPGDDWEHGYSANQPWSLIDADAHQIRLGIDYPADQAIERLERQITTDPEAPALDISLTIWARRDVTVPVALHPTFRVPVTGIVLRPGTFAQAVAYPVPAEPGVSHLIPDGASADLSALPARGGTLDLNRLPLPIHTEELLQLQDCVPPFSLYYEKEGVEVSLFWDPQQLPDVMLWVSNAGRSVFPWNSRNYALGIEPVNGTFDLGRVATPAADHPLGHRRGLAIKKDQPTRIDYRLAVQ